MAIKVIEKSKLKDEKDKKQIEIEIKILKNTFHFNIIKLYEVIEKEEEILIIMEYAEGGDLSSFLAKQNYLNEDTARKIFQQLIDGIYYLHQIGICHRNLKLENILFSSKKRDKIKIIHFGHSNLYLTGVNSGNPTLSFGAEFLETPFGSQEYTPPEMILGCKYDGLLLDIWTCGIILYTMLFGIFPFKEKNIDKLYTKIVKGDFSYPKNINISEEAKLLLKKILVVNPRLRSDIKDIRRDIWFQKDYEQIPGLFISIRDIPVSDIIIEEMKKYGFKKNEIIKYIKNNRHNNITSFYYLLVNKLRKEGTENKCDLISDDFKEYLREQDLKNNLIKKGEKPISLKIMKSNSKSIFNLNDSTEKTKNQKFDLDYLKNIFQEYNSENKIKTEQKNSINKINIDSKHNKKNTKSNTNKKNSPKEKRAKSQNNKNIKKKINNYIFKGRYSYSTPLSQRNRKSMKQKNKVKTLYEKQNVITEEQEKRNNIKRQIINIKEIIKTKNNVILNSNNQKLTSSIPIINPRNHLVINSTSISRKKNNSKIVNINIININNDSNMKLKKIKELKEKNFKNNNIKNLSLKNKYYNEFIYKDAISSRNKINNEMGNEFKTTRNYKHKFIIDSTSSSKSKSLKSKSNYSTGKGETIFCQNDFKRKKNKKYLNKKTNVKNPVFLDKAINISEEKLLKANKNKKTKSISTFESKNMSKKKYNLNTLNKSKSPSKSNKKLKDNKKKLKTDILYETNNSPKNKINNNKVIKKNSKSRNNKMKEERTNSKTLNIVNNIKTHSKGKKDFNININNYNKFDWHKNKKHTKIFSNILEKLNPNHKEISPIQKLYNRKSSSNLNNKKANINKKHNEIIKIKSQKPMNKSVYLNTNSQRKKQNTGRITNIKRSNLKKESINKDESLNKIKVKEIKSIKICNIPKSDIMLKTEKNFNKKINPNHFKTFDMKEEKINTKNRMVINFKKFNNI